VKAKASTSEKPSIIDKMFHNIDKFQDAVLSVDFVSNQLCALNDKKAAFRFTECKPSDFAKIVKSVQVAYPAATTTQVGLLGFVHTNLSLGDVVSHTKGKLQSFIAEQLGPVTFSPEAVYQAIADECRRKAHFKGGYVSLQQVVKDKGLTKANVQEWLDTIESAARSPEWSLIAPDLNSSFAEARMIRHQEVEAVGQLVEEWQSLCDNLGIGVIEKTTESLASAQQTWQHARQRDEEQCQFAQQWSTFIDGRGSEFASRLPSFANLLAGTFQRFLMDAKVNDAIGAPVDLVILEDAEALTEAEIIKLSRLGQRCLLVSHSLQETPATGPFERLWKSLADSISSSCTWRRENERLICQLVPTSPADQRNGVRR